MLGGVYDGRVMRTIQQESCVWRASLMKSIELDCLSSFRLAGDFYMWYCFATAGYTPKIVDAVLASFMHHEKQLSNDREAYINELKLVVRSGHRGKGLGLAWLTGLVEKYIQMPDMIYRRLYKDI